MNTERVTELAASTLRAADAAGNSRFVVAVIGAPGAGKSTLATSLIDAVEALAGERPAYLPMDGFHLDNAVLERRGLLPRKGAPNTFDAAGYRAALERVRAGREEVLLPAFDRELDLARAGAIVVGTAQRLVVTEGNYLLVEAPPWDRISELIDLSIMLEVDRAELERRLVARWLGYGLGPEAARARARDNDLVNADYVIANSRAADIVLRNQTARS